MMVYDVLFDIMTYVLALSSTFSRNDIKFDVMIDMLFNIHTDIMTYSLTSLSHF